MQRNLLLKERLNGLRKERDLTLEQVAEATDIPKSTLRRLENDSPDFNAHETRVGYQDIVALAKFYDVSADYICGLTENSTHRNVAVDKLRLSDEALAELASGKLNTRLLSELITHPDFAGLLAALEVYIDGTVATKINITNKVLDMAVNAITKKSKGITPDVIMEAMADGRIDPDDYIPFKLSRRFEKIARGIHAAHNKPKDESGGVLVEMFGEQIDKYEKVKVKTGSDAESKTRRACLPSECRY